MSLDPLGDGQPPAGRTPTYEELLARVAQLEQQKAEQLLDAQRLLAHERTAELRAERQRLYDVLETMPAMVCLLTPDYHVLFANRAFREKFGEANGRHCYEYCFGLSAPCAFCQAFQVLETGQPCDWEVTTPDGTVVAAHDYPFTDVDGSRLVLEMDLDITEQKRSEAALKQLQETLEARVVERTKQLQETLEARVVERTKQLQESEARFRSVFESAPIGVVIGDLEGRVLESNSVFARMLGYTTDELRGKRFPEFTPPEDLGTELALVEEMLAGKRDHYHVEKRYLRKDGAIVDVRLIGGYLGGPQTGRSLSFVEDITENKRVEREARKSEQRLAAVMEALPVGVAITDATGANVASNAAFERVWGAPRPVTRSVTDYEAYRAWWVETGQPLAPEEWASARVIQTGQPVVGQLIEIQRFDGSHAFVINSAAPVRDDSGTIVGSAVAIQDVTEMRKAEEALRESEDRFRAIAEGAPQLLFEVLPDGAPGYFNRRWREYTGCEPRDIQDRFELVHPEDRERLLGSWREAVRTGSLFQHEYRFRRYDGQYRWFLSRAFPVRSSAGEVIRWFGTATDIHDVKTAEQQLRESDRQKNQFLAVLSHELRNPLTPIRNSLFVLDRVPPDGEQANRARAVIERQVSHLTRLVNDLLDLTRITAGKLRMQFARFDLDDMLVRTTEDYRAMFSEAGIDLDVQLHRGPVWIHGDEARVAQAVGNLLGNAVKFTERGGRVKLTLNMDAQTAMAEIHVEDTGIGVRPDLLPKVFDAFMQADDTLDRAQGGLGLGLALVKSIVELHGGTIAVHSEGLGRGTEFMLRFPLDAQAVLPLGEGKRRSSRPPRRHVLIIDDNRDSADSLRDLLELGEHRVAVTYSGPEGLEVAKELKPEVVICDIGLPGMSGYEVAKALRADEALRSAHLVALSGYALPEDQQRATEAGFGWHVAKPPSPEKLEELLAELPKRERR